MVMVMSFPLMSESAQPWEALYQLFLHGVHTWVAASVPRALASVVRDGHGHVGVGLPQNQPCGALGTSMLVVPKPLSLAPPFVWEGFNVQRAALGTPAPEAEEDQLVLP